MTRPLKIEILRRAGVKVPSRSLELLCRRLFEIFKKNRQVCASRSKDSDVSDLSLIFVGANESRNLNRKYRRKNKPTDVLSFSHGFRRSGLGELVICLPVIRRQALEARHSFKKELQMMVIHGFLHLLGYDHEKNHKEELKMMRLQDKLLKRLT